MNFLKPYIDFVNENFSMTDRKKEMILITPNLRSTSNEDCQELTRMLMHDLFYIIPSGKDFINDDNKNDVLNLSNDIPIIYLTSTIADYWNLKLKDLNCVYGSLVSRLAFEKKSNFAKVFRNCEWNPKTVFKVEDTKELKFPIIAKIDDGHSGLGIKKFDTYEELEKFKQPFELPNTHIQGDESRKEYRNFDLYMECIDFTNEFRSYVVNGVPVYTKDRVGVDGKKSTVNGKDIDDTVDFLYIPQDMNKIPEKIIKQLNEICKEISTTMGNNFFALDWCIDNNNKVWVFEENTGPGMIGDEIYEIYKSVYKDFYKRNVSKEVDDYIKRNYIDRIYKIYFKDNEELIKKSKWPLDYKKDV